MELREEKKKKMVVEKGAKFADETPTLPGCPLPSLSILVGLKYVV